MPRWLAMSGVLFCGLMGCQKELEFSDPEVIIETDGDTDKIGDNEIDTDLPEDDGAPLLQIVPPIIDFGYVPEGDQLRDIITITNVGTADLVLDDTALAGSLAFETDAVGVTWTLAPGESEVITILFTSTANFEEGAWSVLSNDVGLQSVSVRLEGDGRDPAVNGTSLDFGPVHINEDATLAWALDNPGNQPVTITAIESSDPAFSVSLAQPVVIASEQSATVDVVFDPEEVREYAGELTVVSDARIPMPPVEVTGEGVDDPIAICEAVPPSVQVGESSEFRGDGSYDPAGRGITAQWQLITQPNGSALSLPAPDQLNAGSITPVEPGTYEAELTITNELGHSATCMATVQARPLQPEAVCEAVPPTVIAGHEQFGVRGNQSSDPQGRAITAEWTLQTPAGSSAVMPQGSSFDRGPIDADVPGTYTATLVVTNDLGVASEPCTVEVEAIEARPVAICSADPPNVDAATGQFNLIGSNSYDTAGRPLTGDWTFRYRPFGATATMPGGTSLDRGPITPDLPGDWLAQLIVTNDFGVSSAPCEVTVTVSADAPVAWCSASPVTVVAGVDEFMLLGDNSFDPAGRPIVAGTWGWVQRPAGSSLAMPGGTDLNRGPLIADRVGTYIAELEVTNDLGIDSGPCRATVNAIQPDPIAVCDAVPTTVTVGETFQLLGQGSSDPLGGPLTANWTFISTPPGSAAQMPGGTSLNRGPIVADAAGIYQARLTVQNSAGVRESCVTSVTATASPPVAWCSAYPQQVRAGIDSFQLIGENSFDGGGRPLVGFSWTWSSRPSGSSTQIPSGNAPNRGPITPDRVGTYVAELVVTNDLGVSSPPCLATVESTDPGPVAVCEALPDTVLVGESFQLLGQNSYDPLGRPITGGTWSWIRRPAGSSLSMPGGTNLNRGPLTPDVEGVYRAELVVTNSQGSTSEACQVDVTVNMPDRPVAVCSANPTQLVAIHETVRFIGNQSYDPQGRPLSAQWTFVSTPPGSSVTMPGGTGLNRGPITPDNIGDYVAELVVTNNLGISSFPCTATATATVNADVWVELSWTHDEDLDLHLIRGNAARSSSGDCHFRNCRGGLAWGAAGTADDPYLDIDDIRGNGPENINIASPENVRYTVTVEDWYWANDYTGANPFRVRIFLQGILAFDRNFSVSGERDWVDIAEIDMRGTIPVVTPL